VEELWISNHVTHIRHQTRKDMRLNIPSRDEIPRIWMEDMPLQDRES